MNEFYESTRDKEVKVKASEAILQGLSKEGGLFVLRDLDKYKIEIKTLIEKDYYEIAIDILKLFLHDFSEEEIEKCVYNSYKDKFSEDGVTPLVKLKDGYVLELFNGPTNAFKDIALQILPQFTSLALKKSNSKEDILILTATSGDTGKAALEGFKDIDSTKIIVFYPSEGVSKVQEAQMKTQEGENTYVCAIKGNFDDAQTGIKNIFMDEEFREELKKYNIKLSSANSINIGRLVPQIVYYFNSYIELVRKGKIKVGDKINYVVPTGNFGNILAGFYAKEIGLPINKLICASNENNVLYEFLKTGKYDRNRSFLKTNSPSMDILISSNLERLLYYMSGCDNEYIKDIMKQLNLKGEYRVKESIFKKIKETFIAGYATNKETEYTIKSVYEKDNYLLDTHSAVAYKVLLDNMDKNHVNVVLATASPYKFTNSVYESLYGKTEIDEFKLMKILNEKTGVVIPSNLIDLDKKTVIHNSVIEKDEMKNFLIRKVGELK